MAENTKIGWTDHTFNPWMGCTKVSDGCKFCYAETLMDHRWRKVEWGPQGERKRTSEANWRKPLAWNKARWYQCGVCGWRSDFKATIWSRPRGVLCPKCQSDQMHSTRQRVFCASLADVFEDRPELEPWRLDLFDLIEETPNLDWLLLTKRPENVMDMTEPMRLSLWSNGLPDNLWIGTSVEDQTTADRRIGHLIQIPARVRFLSCEPLLAPVNLQPWFHLEGAPTTVPTLSRIPTVMGKPISWVIVGGESGPQARPMLIPWARRLRDQCQAAGVPYFLKQMGGHPDKREALESIPEDLRIREWPQTIETAQA